MFNVHFLSQSDAPGWYTPAEGSQTESMGSATGFKYPGEGVYQARNQTPAKWYVVRIY
jgi:hypothetical protein